MISGEAARATTGFSAAVETTTLGGEGGSLLDFSEDLLAGSMAGGGGGSDADGYHGGWAVTADAIAGTAWTPTLRELHLNSTVAKKQHNFA